LEEEGNILVFGRYFDDLGSSEELLWYLYGLIEGSSTFSDTKKAILKYLN
jgi:hypothetical protein